MFPRNSKELALLSTLNTPQKIQDFLDTLPINNEQKGETCMSPRRVLETRKAHCIEGALLAGVCLMLHGEKPLIVSLKVMKGDYDHIVTLFKRNGYYGAVSKTNHLALRYRDPIYRTVRELVLSYFHEYFLTKGGVKTLIGYSKPINLRRFGTQWVTATDNLWDIAEKIYDAPYTPIIPPKNKKYIRPAQIFERRVGDIKEWKE